MAGRASDVRRLNCTPCLALGRPDWTLVASGFLVRRWGVPLPQPQLTGWSGYHLRFYIHDGLGDQEIIYASTVGGGGGGFAESYDVSACGDRYK